MKADLTNINNIFFDLGNVLLNLDFDASIRAFQKLGLNSSVVNNQHAYADPVFYELETGKISPEDFRKEVREILQNTDATDKQIDDAWSAMVLDIPAPRIQILQKLSLNYNIYLFSNTNKIHIDRLFQSFKAEHGIDFPSLFKTAFYSHDIQDRKPEISSFEKVIELSGVNPAESLFVDDLEKNIRAGEKAGFNSIWLKEGMEMTDLF